MSCHAALKCFGSGSGFDAAQGEKEEKTIVHALLLHSCTAGYGTQHRLRPAHFHSLVRQCVQFSEVGCGIKVSEQSGEAVVKSVPAPQPDGRSLRSQEKLRTITFFTHGY